MGDSRPCNKNHWYPCRHPSIVNGVRAPYIPKQNETRNIILTYSSIKPVINNQPYPTSSQICPDHQGTPLCICDCCGKINKVLPFDGAQLCGIVAGNHASHARTSEEREPSLQRTRQEGPHVAQLLGTWGNLNLVCTVRDNVSILARSCKYT